MLRLNVLGLAVAFAAATPLVAEAHECSVDNFKGRYGFQGLGFDTRNHPVTLLAVAGSIVADGEGAITFWRDFGHFGRPEGPPKTMEENDFVAIVASGGGEITYSVEPDCRITILVPLPAPAPTLRLQGVLVDGGRTAQLLIGSPAYVGTWTAKKTDNRLADDLGFTKDLVKRIAAVNGVLRREEAQK